MTRIAAFYITAHGFGHASRSLEVIRALHAQRPDVRILVRSAVPRWFLESAARAPIEIQPIAADTGMAQIDSITFDERETIRRAASFYDSFPDRVRNEAATLREQRVSLVVGDVPPLAFAAAAQAGLPSVAIANFTWDWIYGFYPAFEDGAPGVLTTITSAYAAVTLALRLPFHGGFEPMAGRIRDIPLIARRSSRPPREVRHRLGLDRPVPIVLASFGGHPLRAPYATAAGSGPFTLVVTAFEAGLPSSDHLRVLTPDELAAHDLTYADLVGAADVVISKPGYGIASECIANGASLLYAARNDFAENAVFDAELPRFLRCRRIAPDDLMQGRWAAGIEALLQQPPPPEQMSATGADVAAAAILDFVPRRD
jgi:L-arabinokinase